jgi:hypothetical protein
VVLLNSTDPYLPAFVALDTALQSAVRQGSSSPVEFFAETLDVHRFEPPQLEENLSALLKDKNQNLKVDVVVTYARAALEFALSHQEDIWPGAAIVFNSVSN